MRATFLGSVHQNTCGGILGDVTFTWPVFRTYILQQQNSRNDMDGPSICCKGLPKIRSKVMNFCFVLEKVKQ